MDTHNTLGEWSDGDDDWVFEVQIPAEYDIYNPEYAIYNNPEETLQNNREEGADEGIIRNVHNTLGEWSDGDDDWVFEVQIPPEYDIYNPEEMPKNNGEESADDEIIRNIPEEMVQNNESATSEAGDSEEEESVTETQTGRGEKRKSDDDDDDGDDDERDHSYYEITGTKERRSKKFKTIIKDTEIRFNNTVENMDLIDERKRTYAIIEQLVADVTGGAKDRDQIHFVLSSEQLEKPIALPFMARAQFTPERVFAAVERVVQSNREFRLNDTVHVNVWHVDMPEGSGKSRKRRTESDITKHLKKSLSVVVIENHDDLCLARALVVAIAKAENDPYYHYLRACVRGQQRRAMELHANANVPLGPCGLEEVRLFQRHLTRYEINIVSLHQNNAIIYPPPEQAALDKTPIYLALHNNHYDVITKMPSFLRQSYFCHRCRKSYAKRFDHLCPEMCRSCRAYDCTWDDGDAIPCDQCKRHFKSRACYDRHKVRVNDTNSICETIHKCLKCKRSMDKRKLKSHLCGKKCPTCNVLLEDIEGNHKCYMQKPKQSDDDGYDQLYFFDFECKQETGEHVPNFCVVQDEKGNEEIFKGDNTVKDFCEWVFRKGHENCIFVAHNFKGYDSYFVQDYLNKNCLQFDLICTGAKIMCLTVPRFKVKFIDSYNFIPMALAKFPETFDRNELRKGYFPHMFNRDDKQDYVGPIPETHYYLPNTMKPEVRQEFLQWHAEQVENNYVFDFQKEMESYCRSDVDILRKCCLDFRDILQETTDIDPFEKSLTIASVCHRVYCTNYLGENTIGVFSDEHRLKTKTSNKAVKWLSWLAETEEINIEHAKNGGEKRVEGYSLDGFCEERNTAYEFHGCFWHGK